MKRNILVTITVVMLVLTLAAGACKSSTTTTETTTASGPSGGALVNSDSIVTEKIQSITVQAAGFPWKLTVMIQSTTNVDTLPNPVADSVGKVVTDQDMIGYQVNDVVTAKIKYTGDVNTPGGVNLYMYSIAR
jgi:ABC-type glycerol-3-phosphate transport system substrate-binding protein